MGRKGPYRSNWERELRESSDAWYHFEDKRTTVKPYVNLYPRKESYQSLLEDKARASSIAREFESNPSMSLVDLCEVRAT